MKEGNKEKFLKKYILPQLENPKNGYLAKDRNSNYMFPRFLVSNDSTKKNRTLNIEYYRQEMPGNKLDQGESVYFIQYEELLKKVNYLGPYIRELVIPVDITIYRRLLEKIGITYKVYQEHSNLSDSDSKRIRGEWNKTYFLLNSYFPWYGINIEIDGSRYHNNDLDRIRDKYIESIYSIRTFRLADFGINIFDDVRLKKIFSRLKPLDSPYMPDISNWLLRYFLYENSRNYSSINILIRLAEEKNIMSGKRVILNQQYLDLVAKKFGYRFDNNVKNDLLYLFRLLGLINIQIV